MPAPPAITSATPADLAPILDLLARSKLPGEGLADHLTTTLVAREQDSLVGCAALELYGRAALLRSVAVDPAWRGRGLGLRLTQAALDLARRHEVHTVYLLTETAGDFFPKCGFRRTTREAVDPAVRRSVEFTTVCPASALTMALDLT